MRASTVVILTGSLMQLAWKYIENEYLDMNTALVFLFGHSTGKTYLATDLFVLLSHRLPSRY